VPATVTYDAASRTATLDPVSSLAVGATYTGLVESGAAGVKDVAGNSLASDYTWAFTVKSCPCSIFAASAIPANTSSSDANAVELGVRFRADVAGTITGIRFYKGANNTGTHVGSLWTNSGALLARATFAGESASGWQTVLFATPVPVVPGVTYVASYHTPNGGYAVDQDVFGADIVNVPLRALANGTDGPNGIYVYSAVPAFPVETWRASNYWVDVLFVTSP
jgi:hypothetical protein